MGLKEQRSYSNSKHLFAGIIGSSAVFSKGGTKIPEWLSASPLSGYNNGLVRFWAIILCACSKQNHQDRDRNSNNKAPPTNLIAMNYNNVDFPDGISFQCMSCGSCCKAHPSDVNAQEQKKIEALGFTDFLEGSDGDVTRRIRAKKDGSCFFLSKDNRCAIYDARPAACKLEPLVITDYDYENNKIKLGINPAALCDPSRFCKELSPNGKMPKEDIAEAAQTTIQEALESFSRQKGLPLTSKEVAFLTRQYFIQTNIIAIAFAEAVSRLP